MSHETLTSGNTSTARERSASGRSVAVNIGGTLGGATITAQLKRATDVESWVDVISVTEASNFELITGIAEFRFLATSASGTTDVQVDTWPITG